MAKSEDIIISKKVLSELPQSFEETSLGDKRGAKKQYRPVSSSTPLHVREYDDKFTIHIDRVDPRRDPVGHLIKDSPETIAAAVTALYFAKRNFERKKPSGSSILGGMFLSGLLPTFIALNSLFRILKIVLFS